MSDINLQLVREFFDLNLFRVLAHWQQAPSRSYRGDGVPQLFVENSAPRGDTPAPMVIGPADIGLVERAVVEIRAWHSDRFYRSDFESSPVFSQFAQPEALLPAKEFFKTDSFATILVISELPHTAEQYASALSAIKSAGIDHVLEFPTILKGLLDRVSVNGLFAASQTLHLLQLLQRYRFVRNAQMEFNFPFDPPVTERIEEPDPEASPHSDALQPGDDEAD